VREEEGILYVNPGSAGPRRFTLPISVGVLEVRDGIATATLITLRPTEHPRGRGN
jgi:predicted phosphodiesterase